MKLESRCEKCIFVGYLIYFPETMAIKKVWCVKFTDSYLKGTISQSLIFKKSQKPLKLEGFGDLDWGNLDDKKKSSLP